MNRLLFVFFASMLALVGCSSLHTSLPLIEAPPPAGLSSSVFVGYAQAFHFAGEKWNRVPEYDYEFIVLERRYADRWEASKEIRYRHPRYDGRPGPRHQTLYFFVRTSRAPDGGLDLAVEGTLGAGKGRELADGGLVIELASAVRGWFIPFDSIRIRQTPRTPNGNVEEVVELFSKRDGREIPFMRMQEEGMIYRAQPLAAGRR